MINLVPWRRSGHSGDGGQLAERRELHPLARLREEMDALMDRFWSSWPERGLEMTPWGFDVEDRENELVVRAEAPGFEADDFDVQVSGNHLLIHAEHKEEKREERLSSYRYGRVHRMIPLPHGVEADKIEARYHNGVLEVNVPKGEEARGKRIAVKAE